MVASYSAELFKLGRRPATWILGGVLLATILLFSYVVGYVFLSIETPNGPPPEQLEAFKRALYPANVVPNVLGLLASLGGPVALILGALVAGSEYGWGTLKTILTQRPTRTGVLVGKLLGMATVLFVFVLASLALGAVASFVVAQLDGEPVNWPSTMELLGGFGAGWLILGTWAMLGFALAVWFRGTALAIGLGLVYGLVLETVTSGLSGVVDLVREIGKFLLGANANALASSFGTLNQDLGQELLVGPTRATITLIVYLVVFAAVSAFVFLRRDVTS